MTERNHGGPDAVDAPARSVEDDGDEQGDPETGDLPPAVVAEAERLTHMAREAVDENEAAAYREERDALLGDHDYVARVREDDTRDVLVCHPEEWVEEGVVRVDRIEDTDRGVERPLSGPGEGDDWEEIHAHNSEIAERVAAEHGAVHGENAVAFAEFMSNHYAKPIESATAAEREEFLTDYFPRNAWPSDEQKEAVETSVALAVEVGDSFTP